MQNVQMPVTRLVERSLAAEFGIAAPPEVMFKGGPDDTPDVPRKRSYSFERARLKDLMVFWDTLEPALKLIGDPAAGKTSLVEQFHARMRWPLYLMSCSSDTQPYQLYGQLIPQLDKTLKWVDGPVLKAARTGASVLLDEYNTLAPSAATSLNALLEGYAITIPETGEVITPAKTFRVFATENSVQSRLSVAGRHVQDAANDERWMVVEVDYIDPAIEKAIVKEALLKLGNADSDAELTAQIIVDTATKVRERYRAEDPEVEKPMSTRVVLRWARLSCAYQSVRNQGQSPLAYSLSRAFHTPSPGMRARTLALFEEVSGIKP